MRSYQTLYALVIVVLSLAAGLLLSGGEITDAMREALAPERVAAPPLLEEIAQALVVKPAWLPDFEP